MSDTQAHGRGATGDDSRDRTEAGRQNADRADDNGEGSGECHAGAARLSRRRALLLGGGALALGAAGAGYAFREDLERFWQLPGNGLPRAKGEVDHPGAEWVAASAANWRLADRPNDFTIDRVVIHMVEGSYATALRVFRDPWHEAAAHYVVREDGHLAQMVRERDVAYHAGNRAWNERSIGIEHAGFVDRPNSLTERMYRASARLASAICERYGIPIDREHIVGHVEVPGTDHTDPGRHWDWDRYLRAVRAVAGASGRESAWSTAAAEGMASRRQRR